MDTERSAVHLRSDEGCGLPAGDGKITKTELAYYGVQNCCSSRNEALTEKSISAAGDSISRQHNNDYRDLNWNQSSRVGCLLPIGGEDAVDHKKTIAQTCNCAHHGYI